jgi:hypothetical protein
MSDKDSELHPEYPAAAASMIRFRKINPSLYTSKEFKRRKKTGSGFLSRVLAGEHIVLMGEEGAA